MYSTTDQRSAEADRIKHNSGVLRKVEVTKFKNRENVTIPKDQSNLTQESETEIT